MLQIPVDTCILGHFSLCKQVSPREVFPCHSSPDSSAIVDLIPGPGEGPGGGGLQPPHFFGNFKQLLRKLCFQPPHFESLFSPPPHFQSSSAGPEFMGRSVSSSRLTVLVNRWDLCVHQHKGQYLSTLIESDVKKFTSSL